MDERLHSMFRNEMSAEVRPSLDGMPEEVLAKGRLALHARRARNAKIASAAFAAVAVGGVAVAVLVPPTGPGRAAAAHATHLGAAAKSAHPGHPVTTPVTTPDPQTTPAAAGPQGADDGRGCPG